jgi:hypothetical protein
MAVLGHGCRTNECLIDGDRNGDSFDVNDVDRANWIVTEAAPYTLMRMSHAKPFPPPDPVRKFLDSKKMLWLIAGVVLVLIIISGVIESDRRNAATQSGSGATESSARTYCQDYARNLYYTTGFSIVSTETISGAGTGYKIAVTYRTTAAATGSTYTAVQSCQLSWNATTNGWSIKAK